MGQGPGPLYIRAQPRLRWESFCWLAAAAKQQNHSRVAKKYFSYLSFYYKVHLTDLFSYIVTHDGLNLNMRSTEVPS